jgi:hypothetical protein
MSKVIRLQQAAQKKVPSPNPLSRAFNDMKEKLELAVRAADRNAELVLRQREALQDFERTVEPILRNDPRLAHAVRRLKEAV